MSLLFAVLQLPMDILPTPNIYIHNQYYQYKRPVWVSGALSYRILPAAIPTSQPTITTKKTKFAAKQTYVMQIRNCNNNNNNNQQASKKKKRSNIIQSSICYRGKHSNGNDIMGYAACICLPLGAASGLHPTLARIHKYNWSNKSVNQSSHSIQSANLCAYVPFNFQSLCRQRRIIRMRFHLCQTRTHAHTNRGPSFLQTFRTNPFFFGCAHCKEKGKTMKERKNEKFYLFDFCIVFDDVSARRDKDAVYRFCVCTKLACMAHQEYLSLSLSLAFVYARARAHTKRQTATSGHSPGKQQQKLKCTNFVVVVCWSARAKYRNSCSRFAVVFGVNVWQSVLPGIQMK